VPGRTCIVFLLRHGLLLDELTTEQQQAVLDILRASFSAAGFQNARDIMQLNEHAAELTGRHDEFGEWLY
jgi:uncharacterized protein DUF3500